MTIHRVAHYYANAVPEAPPVASVRTRDEDWRALDQVDQVFVDLYQTGLVLLDALPAASRTFVRRHHPGRMES
ncbi:MAG: hypothetical protein NUV51_04495 [Sulfuricaulis sp.]|nr:hypothetical protein [Sulfuricaulis sp.]